MGKERKRCSWVKLTNPLYVAYHDEEWGKPVHDDQLLFELLSLETYQAGLSWETVLNKREAFRVAFHNYNINKVAAMTDQDLEDLLGNPAIIRHRGKLTATRTNACVIQAIQSEYGSFDRYIWTFVDGQPLVNQVDNYQNLPSQTDLSKRLSKDLKKRGASFTGPVAMYSFLQAVGLVNDHEEGCHFK